MQTEENSNMRLLKQCRLQRSTCLEEDLHCSTVYQRMNFFISIEGNHNTDAAVGVPEYQTHLVNLVYWQNANQANLANKANQCLNCSRAQS